MSREEPSTVFLPPSSKENSIQKSGFGERVGRRELATPAKKNIYEKIYSWGEWGKFSVWSITQSDGGEKIKYNFCGAPLLKITRRTSGKQYR
ncbi:MAG: hypothetical protein LBP75_00770 [Planctomycetota bacterium]|jgi:hypothetical protein|nr:hypothetical protein [Planctomycetota bacterium]